MTLLVDTSVWSLAFRRDSPPDSPEVAELREALAGSDSVVTTGVIVLELLRGFPPAEVRQRLRERLERIPWLEPSRADYVAAAGLSNTCRPAGVQLGTVDAVIAQLAIAHHATLLTADRDFVVASAHIPLRVWAPSGWTT